MGQCTSKPGSTQKKKQNVEKRDASSTNEEQENFYKQSEKEIEKNNNTAAVVGKVDLEEINGDGLEPSIEQKEDEVFVHTGEENVSKPLSYYTHSENITDVKLKKNKTEESELKKRVEQLENEIEKMIEEMKQNNSENQAKIADLEKVQQKQQQKAESSRSSSEARSEESGDQTFGERSQKIRFALCDHELTNIQLEDMCASTDFIKIFVDQIENVLIDSYAAHGLAFDINFDFNLKFLNFNKKSNLKELHRNKERISDDLINLRIEEVAEEYSRSTHKPMDESIHQITEKLGKVRKQIEGELFELLRSLEQRLDSFCEKYVQVWKDGFALQRTTVVDLDFDKFVASASVQYSANFEQILEWASVIRGKVLVGDEFVDLREIRSQSVLIDV